MMPCSPAGCSSGFRLPREAGAASMVTCSPEGEGLLFFPCFCPPGASLRLSLGFRPPREAGAADVAALASGLFLGVLSPKGSWGGVDDAALASGCRTAVARRWAIRLIAADNPVRLMKADATPGLYTLLPARRRKADVSDLY